jgi:hypothetical protein
MTRAPEKADTPARDRRHLFVAGCPRSGTTAMWGLLVAHHEVAIGAERYHDRALGPDFLHPSLFEQERFLRVEPGDTFYGELEPFHPWYGLVREHYPGAWYHGDKLPLLERQFPRLQQAFGESLRLIVMVRNVFDVAASYVSRASDSRDPTWRSDWGVGTAVREWSESIGLVRPLGHRRDVLIVQYEQLFQAGEGLRELCDFLEIDMTPAIVDAHQRSLEHSKGLEAERRRDLTYRELHHIGLHAAFNDYREVLSAARVRLEDDLPVGVRQ